MYSSLNRSLCWMGTAALVGVLALAACTQAPPQEPPAGFEAISATFDTDHEGWTSTEANAPVWQAPGHIVVVDAGDDWQYAIAPATFHGDWSEAGTVQLRVIADPGPLIYPLRVMISGVDHTLYMEFALNELVSGQWVAFEAPLVAGQWQHFDGDDNQGPIATQDELDATLAEVVDLRVRLDTTTKSNGDESNGLDDVVVE